jgi:cystathionine beta-lyase
MQQQVRGTMKYNFDEVVNRRGTNSVKYDFMKENGKPEDTIPLWVADMDFRTPPAVTEALVKAAEHGIFGYTATKEDYFRAVYNWYKTRFGWETDPSWLVKIPGVVYAVATAIRALTNEGDAVLIQRPVYYPFARMITQNNRRVVNSPLIYKDGLYEMDFIDLEEKIKKENIKLFILCSPHNPVSRVWTKDELLQVGDICIKYGVTIVADEIHGDFIYTGHKHHVFGSLKPEFLEHSVICTAPSKTFNLAGLQASNLFIKNEDIRRRFVRELERTGNSQPNLMGLIACQAAYQHGAEWLDQLKEYLEGNVRYIKGFLQERLPLVKLAEPQGTYLLWLDFREFNLTEEEREDLIVNKAGLWLHKGTMFGEEGRGFERINIACPRSILEKAFSQLEKSLKQAGFWK